MKAIIGLGNPGAQYKNTRHNVGFVLIDWLAERHGISLTTEKFNSLCATDWIREEKVILSKPQTFMNESGRTVGKIADYFDLADDDILVVYDDFHLDLPKVRFRSEGSAGGHNGIKSILQHRSPKNDEGFSRLRIGVGPKTINDTSSFVLGRFSESDTEAIAERRESFIDMIEFWMANGIEDAMNRYNSNETAAK